MRAFVVYQLRFCFFVTNNSVGVRGNLSCDKYLHMSECAIIETINDFHTICVTDCLSCFK